MLKKSSVSIAKDRIRYMITSDRVSCLLVSNDIVAKELYSVISKYIPITEDDFHIKIHRTNIQIYFTGEN